MAQRIDEKAARCDLLTIGFGGAAPRREGFAVLRRLLACSILVVGLSAASAVPVFASAAYCRWDPPVLVTTPSGNLDVVYVDVSSPFANVGEGLASAQTTRGYTST